VSVLSGVIGGRILYALSYPHEFSENFYEIFYPWVGGLTIIGGIVGGAIGGSVFLRYHGIRILPVLDIVAIYFPLAQAIGRLGCFAGGCCYGAPAPANAWWAVTFTHPAGNGPINVPLHPAQLYVAAASFATFVILFMAQKRLRSSNGSMLALFLLLENASRFLVDFWRGDRDPILFQLAEISISQVQIYSLIGIAGSLCGFIWLLNRNKQ